MGPDGMRQCPDESDTHRVCHRPSVPMPISSASAAHIDGCDACNSRLTELDDRTDELVSKLKGLAVGGDARDKRSGIREPVRGVRSVRCWKTIRRATCRLMPGSNIRAVLREGSCRLGRFELLEEIGIGSFGHVFRRRHGAGPHGRGQGPTGGSLRLGRGDQGILARSQERRTAGASVDRLALRNAAGPRTASTFSSPNSSRARRWKSGSSANGRAIGTRRNWSHKSPTRSITPTSTASFIVTSNPRTS